MRNSFSRTDDSLLGRWWWSIDRPLFWAIIILSVMGTALLFSASTSVAEHLKLSSHFFFIKQLKALTVSILAMIVISLMPIHIIRRFAVIGMFVILILLFITPILGTEIKGAVRWIRIFGFNLQASEFAKPLFTICAGWLFSVHFQGKNIPGVWMATGLFVLLVILFIIQPDLGQTIVLGCIWIAQFIVAGLPIMVALSLLLLAGILILGSYFLLSHVKDRIDKWLDPGSADTFQIQKSLEAFADGGWTGTGPGNGDLKNVLPDVHSDFIFAVVGEEFGIIGGVFFIAIISYIIFRILKCTFEQKDLFVILTLTGIVTQFAVQSAINLSSTMGLIPSKGMTLPFVSYGGSSLLAMACAMGVALSFTRKRYT